MWKYSLETSLYQIEITGGSVKISDRKTGALKKEFKGYAYLYTGAVHPEEREFFALENGKHFYVYSLETLELKKRITLPRTYISTDVCGFYSQDGKTIHIPAERYVYEDKERELGHYEYVLCKYASDDYTLIETETIPSQRPYLWENLKQWLRENHIP